MTAPPIEPLASLDQAALLALNNAHAAALSWLTGESLAALVGRARFAWGIAPMRAVLIAFDQDSPYDGTHFRWFQARYSQFVYVDRIVVDAASRGQGLARHLYQALFATVGPALVTCEVNLQPPNPGSDAFHAALGFAECGRASDPPSGKTVRYLARQLL